MARCAPRAAGRFGLGEIDGQTGIWIANLAASAFTTLLTVAYFATGRWTRALRT